MTFAEFKEPIDLAVDRRGRFLIADTDKVREKKKTYFLNFHN